VRLEGIAPASRLVGKQFLIVAILSRWSSLLSPTDVYGHRARKKNMLESEGTRRILLGGSQYTHFGKRKRDKLTVVRKMNQDPTTGQNC
jgi:hypothetical protein